MTVLTNIPNGASNKDIRDTWNQMLADIAALKAGVGTPTPTPTPTPIPTPTPTQLPQQSAIVERWSPDTIQGQSDNTAVTSYTGINGTVATGTLTYRTGGAGGKPYLKASAGGDYLATSSSNPVVTAHTSGLSTTLVVMRNAQATGYGYVAGYTGGSYALTADGTRVGTNQDSVPASTTGLTTLTRVDSIVNGIGATDTSRIYVNGGCLGMVGRTVPGSTPFGIAGNPANGNLYLGEIYDVIVWNVRLTAAEVLQAEKWVRELYALPLPWAGRPYRVFHGDSLTNGYGATVENSVAYKIAQAQGWPLGSWSNLGTNAFTMTQMQSAAPLEIDPIPKLVPTAHLFAWEWHNRQSDTLANIQSQDAAYFAARRSAGFAKLLAGSSIDASDGVESGTQSQRASYNAWIAANYQSFADSFAPLHLISGVGPEGACPNSAPYTPNFQGDGRHLCADGNAAIAADVGPRMAAL